jgi:hypothetical protein
MAVAAVARTAPICPGGVAMRTLAVPEWKVRPHSPLDEIEDNVFTVTGRLRMPLEFERRMTVVRLKGARLLIYSAISLDEAEMCMLEVQGEPAFLVVPNAHHRLDAAAWKQRYPSIVVVAPRGAREQVQKKVRVDTCEPDLDDPDVAFTTVGGTGAQEAALIVRSESGTTLVLNDLVGNLPDEPGVGAWFLRRMGFAGEEPHIPAPTRMMIIEDREALRMQLLRWAEIPRLKRILVSHGSPIERTPRHVLRQLAVSLG